MGWNIDTRSGKIARFIAAIVATTMMLALSVAAPAGDAQDKGDPAKKDVQPANEIKANTGVSVNLPKAFEGYTLIFPMNSTKTQLIDMQGRIVHTWDSAGTPALSTYLLPNGDLLRPLASGGGKNGGKGFGGPGGGKDEGKGPGDGKDGGKGFGGGFGGPGGPGGGGRIQQFTFDGQLVWDFTFAGSKYLPHHDITPIFKDNKLVSVLVVAGEKKTSLEAAAAGRKSGGAFQVDCVLEIKPTGKTTGDIIWEWRVWDHLIQDFDKTKPDYGNVAQHPELIDLNFGGGFGNMAKSKDLDKLKGIGYIGGGKGGGFGGDWTHVNSVVYNADLDQVMISVHGFSELWVIDHSTTKAEAASHKGGRYGNGGDLLYRWGNPSAYRAGKVEDRQLFNQHHTQWIAKGLPGAGNILIYNNGVGRPGGNYSSVEEIVPPMNAKGEYAFKAGTAFGPEKPVWSYTAPKKTDLYSMAMSGVQRLPNGNTLICEAMTGTITEVTPDKELVWKYSKSGQGGKGGFGGFGGFGGKGPPGGANAKDFDPQAKGFPPGGKAGGPGGMGGGMAGLFRAYRYGPDYPGLVGRTLTPVPTPEGSPKKSADKK